MLQALHGSYSGIWTQETETEDFVMGLINDYNTGARMYGVHSGTGNLVYFVSVRLNEHSALFSVFYTNPVYRELTSGLMESILKDLKTVGVSDVACISTNTSPAFKRWIKKHNAEPTAIQYNIKL